MELVERFLDKCSPEPNTGCWFWISTINQDGYGIIRLMGRQRKAHRISWLLFKGDLMDGMLICHVCDERTCVNPQHLFAGSKKDNMRDMVKKGRQPNRKLDWKDVEEIREIYPTLGMRSLGKLYGVNASTIYRVLHNQNWVDA